MYNENNEMNKYEHYIDMIGGGRSWWLFSEVDERRNSGIELI